jgi:dTDP-4-amino-4,6-dideoxygalactose transaminase
MLASLPQTGSRQSQVRRFESLVADYVGCSHAIGVASARLGLHLVLKNLNLEPASEIIVPSFNLYAVIERILDLGHRPVFADIREKDLTINPTDAEAARTTHTRAILATHMFGHPCEMDALRDLAAKHNLALIEDCAHAFGSLYRGKHVGTFGKAGVFSFSVLKLITTFGGGMITTDDDELAQRIRADLERHGMAPSRSDAFKRFAKGALLDLGTRKWSFSLGAWPALRVARMLRPNLQQQWMTETPRRDNSWRPFASAHLDAFQAQLGQSQVRQTHRIIAKRRQVMRWLDAHLGKIDGIQLLSQSEHVGHNGLYYGILVDEPGSLSAFLFAHGIDSEPAEYRSCADLDMYDGYRRPCPVSSGIERRILRIPNHPELSERDVRRIARTIRRLLEEQVAPRSIPSMG